MNEEPGFEDALGEWTLRYKGKFQGTKIKLEIDDADKYLRIISNAGDRGTPYLMQEVRNLMVEILKRELNDETDDNEIKKYVYFNVTKIVEDAQVNLGGTPRYEIEKLKNQEMNKSGLQSRTPNQWNMVRKPIKEAMSFGKQ